MISTIVELTDRFNWGKFLVARFDEHEWARRSLVDGQPLLSGQCGWTLQHMLVLDLQTGEGAMFLPSGLASAGLEKHRVWVCPMFEVFLGWLYDHPEHWADILTLPTLIELDPEKTRGHNAMYGHRRPGPPQEVIDQKARETKLPRRKTKSAVAQRLRYMSPEHIAEDFTSPRERAAIRAAFEWLSLNGFCAWELKRRHVYTTVAMSKSVHRQDGPYQAVVLPVESIRKAEALLDPDRVRTERVREPSSTAKRKKPP
jgi:hypothetical protein